MAAVRILVTGSRDWDDEVEIGSALLDATYGVRSEDVTVVHGGAVGADESADFWARLYDFNVEVHQAEAFASPLERNEYMVDLGADLCLAFALDWASGTGHCARLAREAGIETVDFGVSTLKEDRE